MSAISTASQRPSAGIDLSEIGPDCYSLHSDGGTAHYVNSNAPNLFGRDPHALLGNCFLDIIDRDDRSEFRQALRNCLDGCEPAVARFRLARIAGLPDRHFQTEFRVARDLVDDDGHPLALAVTRDVSDHHSFERELRKDCERAEELNMAKSRFLANMSHELRTPLNAILGFSELLQADVARPMTPERQREYVGLIHGSAKHLLNVLNDILDMSKIEAGKYEIVAESFDLSSALSGCCAMMRGQAEMRGIELSVGDFSDLPPIVADERAVKQIVINLLSNALKFTESGGRVDVQANRTARHVRISVADNGIGISPEHMDELGRPFYQADSKYDRKYEGTGLGLSVVRGLCDLHGGKVAFDSSKDVGTTVTITLPISGEQPRPVPAADQLEVVRLPQPDERAKAPFSMARRAV